MYRDNFNLILEKKDIIKKTLNIKRNGSRIVAFKEGVNLEFSPEFYISKIDEDNFTLSFSYGEEEFESVSDFFDSLKEINFYVFDGNYFFQIESLKLKGKSKIETEIPPFIASLNQREELRVLASEKMPGENIFFSKDTSKVNVSASVKKFNKTCYDISVGGCSFVLNTTEARSFQIGDFLTDIKLKVGGNIVNLQGEVVNKVPVEPGGENELIYKGIKLCIKFCDVDPNTYKILQNFIIKLIKIS